MRINAQHLLWLKSIFNDQTHNWKILLSDMTNGDYKSITLGNVKCKNNFLSNLVALKSLVCSKNLTSIDILSQTFRYNNNLKIDNKPITKNLNDLEFISDLFDQKAKKFLSYEDANRKFNLSALTYNQLVSSIKKEWKQNLKNGDQVKAITVPYVMTTKIVTVQKWTSQTLYLRLLENLIQTPTAFSKWTIENDTQYDLIQQTYNLTSYTKILDTQLRIQHRFYHTNKLHTWGIEASPNCTLCGQTDDLQHHFITCDGKANFWKNLKIWKKKTIDIDINESNIEILLGIHNPNNDLYINFINFVNLSAKNYIRENEDKPIFVSTFLVYFRDMWNSLKDENLKNLFIESV